MPIQTVPWHRRCDSTAACRSCRSGDDVAPLRGQICSLDALDALHIAGVAGECHHIGMCPDPVVVVTLQIRGERLEGVRCCDLLELAVAERVFHDPCHIVGSRLLTGIVQTGDIREMRLRAADIASLLVHHVHEGGHAAVAELVGEHN